LVPVDSLAGCGCTDLHPSFQATVLREQGPTQGVVHFTDGLGPYPEEELPFPKLWMPTKSCVSFACGWALM
jgi:predicted metal-dependent peptidase